MRSIATFAAFALCLASPLVAVAAPQASAKPSTPEPESTPSSLSSGSAAPSSPASPPAATAPSSAPAVALTSAPDVVKLKNGSIYRGTIAEMIPGDHLVLVLLTGETRRFPMSDVEAAGPAPSVVPPSPPPPKQEGVPVQLTADRADVAFLLKSGQSSIQAVGWSGRGAMFMGGTADSYSTLCTAPCKTSVPAGTYYHFGLSEGGGGVREPKGQPVNISGPGTLDARYKSNGPVRAVGGLLFFGGLIAGSALMIDGANGNPANTAEVGAGAGVVGAGVLLGLVMLLVKDEATLTFTPTGQVAPLAGKREGLDFNSRGLLLRF